MQMIVAVKKNGKWVGKNMNIKKPTQFYWEWDPSMWKLFAKVADDDFDDALHVLDITEYRDLQKKGVEMIWWADYLTDYFQSHKDKVRQEYATVKNQRVKNAMYGGIFSHYDAKRNLEYAEKAAGRIGNLSPAQKQYLDDLETCIDNGQPRGHQLKDYKDGSGMRSNYEGNKAYKRILDIIDSQCNLKLSSEEIDLNLEDKYPWSRFIDGGLPSDAGVDCHYWIMTKLIG